MRAPHHGAKPVSLLRLRCPRPDCAPPWSTDVASCLRPLLLTGLSLFVAGLCGCNSMSGNWNNQIGMWNYQQGNFQAAREQFYRAVADDPQSPCFAYNLASAMRRQGDVPGAEANYLRAIRLDPSHQPSYHALASLMIDQGRLPEATRMISAWSEARPTDAGAQIEMAWIEHENGDLKAAEQSLYRSLAARPNNSVSTAQLGQLYQEMGQYDRAAVMFRRSLQVEWFQPQVQARLAMLQNPNSPNGSPPPTLAFNFGGPTVPSAPECARTPAMAQIAVVPSQTNDDPAHLVD
jgi:Tfp pilus assembly protein PilF